MTDYYAILEIPKTARLRDVRAAYRRLAFVWHPDRNKERAEYAHQRFLEVAEAFAVLSRSIPETDAVGERTAPRRNPHGSTRRRDRARFEEASGVAEDTVHRAFRARLGLESWEPDRRPGEDGPTYVRRLRQFRVDARRLSRELAIRVDSEMWLDAGAFFLAVVSAVIAFLGQVLVFLPATGVIPRPPVWLPGVAFLFSAMMLAYVQALRSERAKRLLPIAAEILRRRRDREDPDVISRRGSTSSRGA